MLGSSFCPKEIEFLRDLFTGEELKIEREMDREIGAASAVNEDKRLAVVLDGCVEEGAEQQGKALPIDLRPDPMTLPP